MAGRLGEKDKELVKKSEWQIEQPVRCLSRRLRLTSVGCGCRSSGRDFFIWLPIKRLSLRSTNRWAMSLVTSASGETGMKPIPRSVNLALAGLFKHPLKDILFLSGWPWNIMDRQQRSQ